MTDNAGMFSAFRKVRARIAKSPVISQFHNESVREISTALSECSRKFQSDLTENGSLLVIKKATAFEKYALEHNVHYCIPANMQYACIITKKHRLMTPTCNVYNS